MLIMIIGLVLFLGAHSVSIVQPSLRERVIARHGRTAWMLSYTAKSVAGLVLIVIGYGLARQDPMVLYTPPAGVRHLALVLMLPVFPLLIATYVPGRIRTLVRHPMLIATVFWAVAHLLANGMLADVILFGSFLVWALADMISLSRRPAKTIPTLPVGPANDVIAVVAGLAVYALFMGGLHRWLFGVAPV